MNAVLAILVVLAVGCAIVAFAAGWTMLRRRRLASDLGSISSLIRAGRGDEARKLAERWARRPPRDPMLRMMVMSAFQALGDYDRVLDLLDDFRYPLTIGERGRLIVGDMHRRVDELRYRTLRAAERESDAASLLADFAINDPGARWVRSARFVSAVRTHRLMEVEGLRPAARLALAENPLDIDLVQALATDALDRFRFDEAEHDLEAYITAVTASRPPTPGQLPETVWPREISPGVFVLLGVARSAQGADTAAEEAFREAVVRSDHADAESLIGIARAGGLVLRRDFKGALRVYEGLDDSLNEGAARLGAAECHLRLGRLDEAEHDLLEARSFGASGIVLRSLEARLHADRGNTEEAVRAIEDVVPSDLDATGMPLFTLAYVRVACALPGAEDALRRYAGYAPDDPDFKELLDRTDPAGRPWRGRIAADPAD